MACFKCLIKRGLKCEGVKLKSVGQGLVFLSNERKGTQGSWEGKLSYKI